MTPCLNAFIFWHLLFFSSPSLFFAQARRIPRKSPEDRAPRGPKIKNLLLFYGFGDFGLPFPISWGLPEAGPTKNKKRIRYSLFCHVLILILFLFFVFESYCFLFFSYSLLILFLFFVKNTLCLAGLVNIYIYIYIYIKIYIYIYIERERERERERYIDILYIYIYIYTHIIIMIIIISYVCIYIYIYIAPHRLVLGELLVARVREPAVEGAELLADVQHVLCSQQIVQLYN